MIQPTKIDTANPPPSNRMLFATWSKAPRMSVLHADGMPSSVIATPQTSVARLRSQPSPSIAVETTTSSNEIADVSAPTTSAAKNSTPTTRPIAPMLANAFGSVMNSAPTVLAPTSSERSSAKISGNTTSPAMNAIPMSEIAITELSFGRWVSWLR